MLTQPAPNAWSCLPTAFANVTDTEINSLLASIGHDGSEILYPNQPGVACRRAFHPQECIYVLAGRGFEITCFEKRPRHGISVVESHELAYDHAFDLMLARFSGVVVGHGGRRRHAVAWDHKHKVIIDNGHPRVMPFYFGDTFFAVTRRGKTDFGIRRYPEIYPDHLPTQEQILQSVPGIPTAM